MKPLQTLLLLLVTASGCANSQPDFRVAELGPGGVPAFCRLPDCAIPGEFSTIEEAAFTGLEALQQISDWREREYGGCVYEERPGVYRATHAGRLRDDAASRRYCITSPPPDGRRRVAEFHNHPRIEGFSITDAETKLPQYLLIAMSMSRYSFDPITSVSSKWQDGQWTPWARWERGRWSPP